jgi:hypothetical protein
MISHDRFVFADLVIAHRQARQGPLAILSSHSTQVKGYKYLSLMSLTDC